MSGALVFNDYLNLAKQKKFLVSSTKRLRFNLPVLIYH
jgi:hypothetical protein